MSSAARGQHGAADFNPLAPEGAYSLVLDEPTDRAVALQVRKSNACARRWVPTRMCVHGAQLCLCCPCLAPLQLCKFDFASTRGDLMTNIKLDGISMKSCKAMNWPEQ